MKHLILPLMLVTFFFGFSQSKTIDDIEIKKETKVERVDISVTIDSIEELESTFTTEDIRDLFDLTQKNQTITFELVCNGDMMASGKKSHMSYKIEGSSNDETAFLKSIETIKNAAFKYYKNRN